MDLHHCLTLSRLTGRLGDTGLRDILHRSRERNPARGLTGALLFDGERFVQLLEGPREAVQALAERIRADPRHEGLTVVVEGPAEGGLRRCATWQMGYADPDAVASFEAGLAAAEGHAAIDAFLRLLAGSDVE